MPDRPSIAPEISVADRRLQALTDPALRLGAMRAWLTQPPQEDVVDFVRTLCRDAVDHPVLWLYAAIALEDEALDPLRHKLGEGDLEMRRLFGTDAAPSDRPADFAVPEYTKGRPLTLGERKTLARGRDRQLLARALGDPHPDVVRILLNNPSLTEDDVVKLCAKRPIPPKILLEVFTHLRWIVRPRVRFVLATHPDCPYGIALRLVPTLDRQSLKSLAGASNVRPAISELSGALLERKLGWTH